VIPVAFFSQERWRYFNEEPPNGQAKIFAENIIGDIAHSSPTFTPNYKQIYWSTVRINDKPRKIYYSEYSNNHWSSPKILFSTDDYNYDQPFLSKNGNKLYFGSDRPSDKNQSKKMAINVCQRNDTQWSTPVTLNGTMWTPSLTQDGVIYFIDQTVGYKNNIGIYRAYYHDGTIIKKELLPTKINRKDSQNWCPFISPDESFLLFCSDRNKNEGDFDIYISYRDKKAEWSNPMNLGDEINTEFQERFPSLSREGKYLFFTRSKNEQNKHSLYWIDVESVNVIIRVK
jgi:Tol biopolymer transport system component